MEKPHGLYRRLITAPRVWRTIIGVLLIIGGLLSILPLLGIWMLPLGLFVIFFDKPWVRRQWLKARQYGKSLRRKRRDDAPERRESQ